MRFLGAGRIALRATRSAPNPNALSQPSSSFRSLVQPTRTGINGRVDLAETMNTALILPYTQGLHWREGGRLRYKQHQAQVGLLIIR